MIKKFLFVPVQRVCEFKQVRKMAKFVSNYTTTVSNSSEYIDMRSDTVTLPTTKMFEAMSTARLGDDVYNEDPTIHELETRCAKLFNKEAAIFVASGTMGNLLAVLGHCQRGDEIIVGRTNHVHRFEQGNYAHLGGVSATTLNVLPDGTMDLQDIREAIRVKDSHMPKTRLICLETTHNFCGAKALPLEYLKTVREFVDNFNKTSTNGPISIHIDGARIYNAAIKLGCSVADIASYADSVMMCLSKSLGAPIGSVLVGSREFIDKARWSRKAVGGGWRQAGVLAAAALVALDGAEATVRRDHEMAKFLSREFNAAIPDQLKKKIFAVEENITNMVLVHCLEDISPITIKEFFAKHKILVMQFDEHRLRIVPNQNVSDEGIQHTVEVFKKCVATLS